MQALCRELGIVAFVALLAAAGDPAWSETVIKPLGAEHIQGVELSAVFPPSPGVALKEIHIEVWAGPIVEAEVGDKLPAGLPKKREDATVHQEFVCLTAAELAAGRCTRKLEDFKLPEATDLLVSVVTWYVAKGEELAKPQIRLEAIRRSVAFAVGKPTGHPKLAWPLIWHETYPLEKVVDLAFTHPNGLAYPVERVRQLWEKTFDSSESFGALLASRKDHFNLWMLAPVEDGKYDPGLPCAFDVPKLAVEPSHFMDGIVLVHEDRVADCGYIEWGYGGNGLNGRGSVRAPWLNNGMVISPTAGVTLVHEMGHFLFEQSDEYDQMGGYAPKAACANVRLSESECQADLKKSGVSSSQGVCRQFQGSGSNSRLWRSYLASNTDGEIMELSPAVSASVSREWGATSTRCVEERLSGSLVGSSRLPSIEKGQGVLSLGSEGPAASDGTPPRPPEVPKGVPGIIREVRTCKTSAGLWLAPGPSSGAASLRPETGQSVLCREAPPDSESSCEESGSRTLGGDRVSWIAMPRSREEQDKQKAEPARCWYIRETSGSEYQPSLQAGPCVPRIAVEGMGVIEAPIGLQIVIALEGSKENEPSKSFCVESPKGDGARPPATKLN